MTSVNQLDSEAHKVDIRKIPDIIQQVKSERIYEEPQMDNRAYEQQMMEEQMYHQQMMAQQQQMNIPQPYFQEQPYQYIEPLQQKVSEEESWTSKLLRFGKVFLVSMLVMTIFHSSTTLNIMRDYFPALMSSVVETVGEMQVTKHIHSYLSTFVRSLISSLLIALTYYFS